MPLKTKITLKSPLEGQKLDPYHKPEEFLVRTVANLQVSAGWEANVQGKLFRLKISLTLKTSGSYFSICKLVFNIFFNIFHLGMASIVRMARHHPDYLLTEFKPLVQHVMTHVKNLRSQVKFFHELHPIKLWN